MPSSVRNPVPGVSQPLRSAMKHDDDGERPPNSSNPSNMKAAHFAEPTPEEHGGLEESLPKRQFSAGIAKRLCGRSPVPPSGSSKSSLPSQTSAEGLSGPVRSMSPPRTHDDPAQPQSHHREHHRRRIDFVGERILAQVNEWLQHERMKRLNRKTRLTYSLRKSHQKAEAEETEDRSPHAKRRLSIDSQSSEVSFDRLQKIIDDSMSSLGLNSVPHYSQRVSKKPHQRRRASHHKPPASSDTEFYDGDVLVPDCDGVLDNSKTLSFLGGTAADDEEEEDPPPPPSSKRIAEKEHQAWLVFKSEIIRLAHTLKLKGWRRVPLDSGDAISVERLSGALTNAVYVVTPPKHLTEKSEPGKKTPSKLLLRVYGPQVEHIIDRENELSVLRRLGRKKIGPRLLGTFANGRFEQYLNAVTLTSEDLRDPDTSKQIAKRMRELHDGMPLLDEERNGGPAVLKNWDHWFPRVSQTLSFLDKTILAGNHGPVKHMADAWKTRGFVCGTDWPTFKAMFDKYRQYLFDLYGGSKVIKEHLVFCHNDTQYGNILRVRPDDKKSPLLQPNYEHKQLVVIDFEYAAANVRGFEFANHFTEWCYDYHDEEIPFACNVDRYPTLEEQYRLIKAYVNHRPEYPYSATATPVLTPLATPIMCPSTPCFGPMPPNEPVGAIADFMLDGRVPPGGWKEEERRREEQDEEQIKQLIEETRLWRPICSAMWIAWGIMQAKIPGYDTTENNRLASGASGVASTPEEEEEDPVSFDYLGYAQQRAMFFWGDCVSLGLVKLEELPEFVRKNIKFTQY